MSATLTKLVTAEEFMLMPSFDRASGGDARMELIRGEVKRMSLTKPRHGLVCIALSTPLATFVAENALGYVFGAETGFQLESNPDTVMGIDVAYVSHEQVADLGDLASFDKYFPFAPQIAAEVLSPSNSANEMEEKIALYFAAGARLVWIVNPKRNTVAVYETPYGMKLLTINDTLTGGDVLPGFALPVAKIFAL